MKSLLLCLLIILQTDLAAQETVAIFGRVSDRISNENLVGASVGIKGENRGAITNKDGVFHFNYLKPGKIVLHISYVGFEFNEITVDAPAGGNINVEVKMDVDIKTGDEIVIGVFNRPEKVTNAPGSVSVIGIREIEQFPGSNIGELAARTLGVEYVRTGVDGINFNARGLNSAFNNKVLFITDGRNGTAVGSGGLPLNNSHTIIKDDIERLEIILGPQSALYGPNAYNAVFNFITKDPRKYQGTTASLSAGSRNQFSGRLRHAEKINNKWAYKLTGEIATGREFFWLDSIYAGGGPNKFYGDTVAIPERNVNFDFRRLRGEAQLYYSFKPNLDLVVSGGASSNTFLQVTTGGRNQMRGFSFGYLQAKLLHPDFYLTVYNQWGTLGTSYSLGPYTRDFYNRTHSTVEPSNPFYPIHGRLTPEEAEAFATRPVNRFKEENQRINAEGQYNHNFEKAGIFIVGGLNYQKDKPNGFGINLVDSFQRIYVTQYGAVLQLEKSLPLGLRLVSAARYDHHSNFGDFVSPKFAVVKKLGAGSLRFGWARAYAMPSILMQYSRIGGLLFGNGEGITYIPNNAKFSDPASYRITTPLVPEEVSTWEGGFKGSIAKNLYIDFNAYYGDSKNFLTPPQSVGGRALKVGEIPVTHIPSFAGTVVNDTLKGASFSTYFNYGEVSCYGIDAAVNYRFHKNISLDIRYSWFGSDITEDNPKNDGNSDNYVSPEERSLNAPQHRAVAILNFTDLLKKKMYVSVSARYVQQYEFYSGSQVGTIAGEGNRGSIERPGKPALLKNYDHGPLGGFTTVDLYTGYRLNDMVKMEVGVTNLLNTEQIEFVGSPSISRLFMFELSITVPNLKKTK